jgi:uncharacterized protein involved in exopolysaccharide biosynthesis
VDFGEEALAERKQQVDLLGLWRVVWEQKYLIGALTLFGGVVAAIVALNTVPTFRAEAVITEVNDSSLGGAASLVNQLGGLASLAGVNLAGMTGNKAQAQAVLGSRHLAEEFVSRQQLTPLLIPDKSKNQTLWFAVKKFQDGVLAIRQDTRKSTTTVSVTWKDPAIAARWANDYVSLANEQLRNRAMSESKRNIDYLTGRLAQPNSVDMQKAMYNLIENETKTLMLANGRTDYAFSVVDPATPPELRFRPQRTIMVIIGAFVGGLVGCGWVFLRRRLQVARSGDVSAHV